MRPTYGYPENFRESLSAPTAILFVKFLMGFCSEVSYCPELSRGTTSKEEEEEEEEEEEILFCQTSNRNEIQLYNIS